MQIRVILIVWLPPRLTSFWIISFPISSNFLSNSTFPPSPAGRLEQLMSTCCEYISMWKLSFLSKKTTKKKGNNGQPIDWNKNHLFCRHCMCITESCPTTSMLKVEHFKRGPSTLLRFKIYCFSSARSKHLQIFVKSPELMPIVRLIPMKVVAKRISIWKHYWADIQLQREWLPLQRWRS